MCLCDLWMLVFVKFMICVIGRLLERCIFICISGVLILVWVWLWISVRFMCGFL